MPATRLLQLHSDNDRLRAEIAELRQRLDEAEQALEAIRTGQVESLVVDGPGGPRIFSLEDADHSYRALVEAMNEGAATLSEQGTVLYCNARFAHMLGLPLERVMGSRIHQFLPLPSQAVLESLIRDKGRGEVELLREGAENVPAYLSVSAIQDAIGSRLCLVAADLRIQKRNEAILAAERVARSTEEARRQSDERYRHLFQNLSEGFALYEFSFDTPGTAMNCRFLEINAAFERMTGLSRADVLGQELLEVLPSLAQHWIDRFGEVARAGGPVRFDSQAPDLGREYEAIAFAPGAGKLATLFVDMTERRRLQRLFAVLSQVNEAIVRTRDERVLFDDVCRIVVENTGAPVVWIGLIQGGTVEPVAVSGPQAAYVKEIRVEIDGELGRGPTGTCIRESRPEVNHDFELNPSTEPWREAARRHGIRGSAAFPIRKNGHVIGAFTLYSGRTNVFDAAQLELLEALCANISHALAAIDDERNRRQTEQALREADRAKNDFLALLSHELRNPLAPINNSLYILDHAPAGSEAANRALGVIQRQARQLNCLVEDLLDVTRISRSKIQLQLRRTDLRELVRLAVEDQRSLFAEAGVQLVTNLAQGPIPVEADWNRLTQVIGNLLQNAMKFTRRGGSTTVTVQADPLRKKAGVTVRDTGIGIEPQVLSRLFQPFTQAEQALDRNRGGLGLGLALVKGFVELHGGTVAAKSEGTGTGAEFSIELSLAPSAAASSPARASGQTVRHRILVIEDNRDAADTLREALEYLEHDVEVAYDGGEGLAKAKLFRPAVVLCDLGLPVVDGYAVARTLRSHDEFAGTLLIALSGYTQPEDLRRTRDAGFDQHIAKPPKLDDIDQLLRSWPSQRD